MEWLEKMVSWSSKISTVWFPMLGQTWFWKQPKNLQKKKEPQRVSWHTCSYQSNSQYPKCKSNPNALSDDQVNNIGCAHAMYFSVRLRKECVSCAVTQPQHEITMLNAVTHLLSRLCNRSNKKYLAQRNS